MMRAVPKIVMFVFIKLKEVINQRVNVKYGVAECFVSCQFVFLLII